MQLALSRIWTRVAVAISDDDNHYTSFDYGRQLYFTFYSWVILYTTLSSTQGYIIIGDTLYDNYFISLSLFIGDSVY